MKWLTAFKIARKILVEAGNVGLEIKGRNPAEIDRAVEQGAKGVIGALKKKPGPTPLPPSKPGA